MILQAISAIVSALIAAATSIYIARIQTSKSSKSEQPKIVLPPGAKSAPKNRNPLYLIVLFITIVAGTLGYFVGGAFSTKESSLALSGDPIFTDEFLRLETGVWKIENPGIQKDSITVENGKLNFDFSNIEKAWDSQYISVKNLPEYSAVEFKVVILEASGFSTITLNTNCHGKDRGSLFTEIGWNSSISGNYEVYKDGSVELVNLGWSKPIEIGKDYIILLRQDNNLVRVYINGIEMPSPFPCDSIGPNLFIGSTADKGNKIRGSVDYVKVWK